MRESHLEGMNSLRSFPVAEEGVDKKSEEEEEDEEVFFFSSCRFSMGGRTRGETGLDLSDLFLSSPVEEEEEDEDLSRWVRCAVER